MRTPNLPPESIEEDNGVGEERKREMNRRSRMVFVLMGWGGGFVLFFFFLFLSSLLEKFFKRFGIGINLSSQQSLSEWPHVSSDS